MRLAILSTLLSFAIVAAAQTGSPSAGCLPLEVSFTPPDGGSVFWDFGDGATSTLASPQHVYTGAGNYTARVFRSLGGPQLGTVAVRVFPIPDLNLTQDTSAGCAALPVNFEGSASAATGITVNSINWAFGDGRAATGINVANTYVRAGVYDVSIQIETNFASCNLTEIFEDAVEVFAQPMVAFTTDPSPAQSCDIPLEVSVNNRTVGADPVSYLWDFGNGTTNSSADPDPVSYTRAGAYDLRLTATDANGCSATVIRPVSAGPPSANFDLPDTVCFEREYIVNALGAADEYDWNFGPGIVVISGEDGTRTIQFTNAGATTIGLDVENTVDGCSNDTVRTLFVERAFVDAVSDPNYSCEPNFVINYSLNNLGGTVQWIFPGGRGTATSRDTQMTYQYDQGGEYGQNWYEFINTTVVVTTPQGCVADTILVDVVDVPNALFMPDVTGGCVPLTVTFADSVRSTDPVTNYQITWGDGQVEDFSAGGPWQHTYASPGEYQAFISMVNSRGCRDTSYSIPIEVGEQLTGITYTTDIASTCPGDTLLFVNTTDNNLIDAFHFQVEGGASHHCYDQDSLVHVLTDTIAGNTIDLTFSVVYNGCITEVTESFPYTPGPRADLGYKTTCETPFDFTFYNRAKNSDSDSLIILGVDSMFRDAYAINDSLILTLPVRGSYQGVLISDNSTSVCEVSTDTVNFFVTVPEAIFEIDSLLCAGLPLDLDGTNSQDVNATCSIGYQWDFTFRRPYVTSSAITDDVTADAQGKHMISLIVEDINGCVDTSTVDVELFGTQLTPMATDQRICLPADVGFTLGVVSDTTVVSYMWDFGGFGTATTQNASTTFPDLPFVTSPITVTITTTDELGCPGSGTIDLEVYEPMSQVFTSPLSGEICIGESVEFTATDFTDEGSNLRYAWNFGNGQTSMNRNETVTYNTAGLVDAVLIYTEVATGCQNDTTIRIDVQEPPELSFSSSVDGQSVVCFPEIITFTNTSTDPDPFTAIWLGGPVPAVGDEYVAALDRGTTTISLLGITTAGCADTIMRDFTLVGPGGGFNFTPNEICPGQDVTFMLQDTVDVEDWTWDFGNGVTETNTNPATANYSFRPPSGQTIVSVTFSSTTNSCTFTASDTINFRDIVADFTTDLGTDFACEPTVMFVDQSLGAQSWSYDFGGSGVSTEPSPTFTFPSPGVYSVSLAVADAAGGCRDTTTKAITILAPLDLNATARDTCAGQSSTIIVSTSRDVASVIFSPNGLIASQNDSAYTTVPLSESTNFSITVTDTFGCSETIDDVNITIGEIFSQPNDTFVILRGGNVTLPIENPGGYTFTWDDPDNVGCTSCDNPTVSPSDTRSYQVNISDVTGCTNTTVVFLVIVAPEPRVPNLFTPNADGTNDDWGPLFPEGITPTVEVYQVYSRWGTLVFESSDPRERWLGDNKGNGEPMPSDVYAYVIKLLYEDGSEFNDAGELTLLR